MKLQSVLNQLGVSELKTIANSIGLKLPYYYLYRQDIGEQISRQLTDPSVISTILSGLDPQARAALDALIAQNGRMMARLFFGEFGSFSDSAGAYARQDRYGKPSTAAQSLADCGLIYLGYMDGGAWRGEAVFIPDDLMPLMPKVAIKPFSHLLATAPPPAYVAVPRSVVRDIGMLLCMCQRDAVRAVYGDRLSKRDVLKLNDDMSYKQDLSNLRAEADAQWITFVHHAATQLALVAIDDGRLIPTHKGEDFLGISHDKQLRTVCNAFMKDGSWSDVSRCLAPGLVYTQPDAGYNVAIRGRIVAALKHCPPGQWLTIASLDKAIRAHDPAFLRSRAGDSGWQPWQRASEFLGGWDVIEAPLLRYVLCGPLLWLGLVQVGGPEANGEPDVFRMTEQGAILLGLREGRLEAPEATPVVIQPNFDVVVQRETPPGEVFLLQQVATLIKRDQASLYRIDQTSFWRCLRAGHDIDKIIATLERIARRDLPQNVAYTLRGWAQKYGEITIERVTLLRTTSDALLAELRANRKLAVQGGETLSPRAMALDDPDTAGLLAVLQKAGYWPKITGRLESDAAASTSSTAEIRTPDLVALLAAALAFQRIGDRYGWTVVPDAVLQRTLTRLSPQTMQQIQRIAEQTVAQAMSVLAEPDEDQ